MAVEGENSKSLRHIDSISLVYLLGTSLFYGLLIVIQKIGLDDGLDPLSFSFARSLIVIPISLLFFSSRIKKIKFINRDEFVELVAFGMVAATAILVLFLGQKYTTAVNAGFLTRLTPVFVLPLCYILFKKRFSRKLVSFMFIMLFGAFILTTEGALIIPHQGDLLIIGAAFLFAFENVYAKKLMFGMSTDVVIFFRIFGSSLVIIFFIPIILGSNSLDAMFKGVDYVILSSILYFLSIICHYQAIKRVGAFLTSTFFLFGSLFSALFAYLFIGETLSFIQWLGTACILIGGLFLMKKI